MLFLDYATPTLYAISAVAALYTLIFYGTYFRKKLKRGVFNLLALAVLVHIVTQIWKMTTLFVFRVTSNMGVTSEVIEALRTWGWFFAMCGTTFSFCTFACLSYKYRFEMWAAVDSILNNGGPQNAQSNNDTTNGREI